MDYHSVDHLLNELLYELAFGLINLVIFYFSTISKMDYVDSSDVS